MKALTLALTALILMPAAAFAQATAGSHSHSGAQSAVILEGSTYGNNTPGLGGIGANSTAGCVIGSGAGVVLPGFGAQATGGKMDRDCVTRQEAAMLAELLNMPDSPGKRAAIHHACAYSESLRHTLVAVGACRMVAR